MKQDNPADDPCARSRGTFLYSHPQSFLNLRPTTALAVDQNRISEMDKPIPICVSIRYWLLSASRLLVRIDIELDEE